MKQTLFLLFLLVSFGLKAQEYQTFRLFYPDGLLQDEGTISGTRKQGVSYVYSAEKQLLKKVEYVFSYPEFGHFENAQFTEKITYYSPEGEVISIQEFENGKNITKYENRFPNGQLKSETLIEADNFHKTTIYYFDNGKVKSRFRFYENGRKIMNDGLYESFYETGQQQNFVNYKNGVKEGTQQSFSEKGVLLSEFEFINDTIVSHKQFNNTGKQLIYWSKFSPEETHFSKEYYSGDSVLKMHKYNKRFQVDTASVVYTFFEYYDNKGNLTNRNVQTKGNTVMFYGLESVAGTNYVSNMTFNLHRKTNIKEPFFELSAGYKVEQQGFYLENMLKFPLNSNLKDRNTIIKEALERVQKRVQNKEVNEQHMVNDSMFAPAFDYYSLFPKQVLYTDAEIHSNLDSTQTGDYRIEYKGTEMYFVGSLKNGLQNGKAQLFLNKNQLLFERNYVMGFQHGLSKDWFLDGVLCSEIMFEYNKIKHAKYYHSNGQLWKEEGYNEKFQEVFKQRWTRNGKILEYMQLSDTLNQSFLFYSDGSFQNYNWVNKKDHITISRTLYNNRNFASIEIPHDPNNNIVFKIEFGGVTIEGNAKWNDEENKAVLNDNYGELVQFDRSVISYPKELPCACKGWEDHDFFAQVTSEFVDEKQFLKYQFDFHAPVKGLSSVFGNPYNYNQRPDEYKLGQTYTTYSNHFLAKPLVISLPDTNGVQLVIEPCKSRFAFIKLEISTSFKVGSYKETTATIHKPKQIALQFPTTIMSQLDAQFNPLNDEKGVPYKGMFLFEAKEIQYDYYKEINVTYPKFIYGRPMLLGTSGLILDTKEVAPDFSSTENYPAMKAYWNKTDKRIDSILSILKVDWSELDKFRGASITAGQIYLPKTAGHDRIKCDIKQCLISSNYCLGAVSFQVTPTDKPEKFLLKNSKGTTQSIVLNEFQKQFNSTGIQLTKPVYNASNQEVQFFIYFKTP